MKDSIFTKIINGDIPSYKIYEDERTYAFLDINPIQPGHVLVVPRAQVDHIYDLDPEDYQAVMETGKLLAAHMKEELQTDRVCMMVVGFEMPHAHLHLVPCNSIAEFMQDSYEADEDELRDMQERLSY